MKDNMLVSTMPIKPQKNTNIGMLIAPTLVDFLGDVFETEKIISMNALNSYYDKYNELTIYKEDIKNNKINFNRVFVDKDHVNDILKSIEQLYYQGILSIKKKEKIICDCGKIDMLNDALKYNAKLFHIENEKIICNHCGQVCKNYSNKVLCLELKDDIDDSVNIAPIFLKKEMNGFSKQYKGIDILISKNRNTGYYLTLENEKYYIDIDFLWNNFFKLFNQDNQILLASNHQLLLMYLMNYFSKIATNKKLTFVANPYVLNKNVDITHNYFENNNEYFKKLFILYNLKWRKKTCYWSESINDYLSNISDKKLLNLYKTILISSKNIIKSSELTLDEQIDKILIESTNMQDNIKLMKKLYKDGLL